jgi:hypothetical protein
MRSPLGKKPEPSISTLRHYGHLSRASRASPLSRASRASPPSRPSWRCPTRSCGRSRTTFSRSCP